MTKDNALEELFQAQKPHFDDSADFMAALTKRLNAVEFIKQHQEATIRHYKKAMIAAFLVGVVCGGVSIGYLLTSPVDEPLITFGVKTGFLQWLSENSRLITATILSLLTTIGITSIIGNIHDIRRMRISYQKPEQG